MVRNAAFIILVLGLISASAGHAGETNLVGNGSFERSSTQEGVPDFWTTSGNRAIKQQLVLDRGRDGSRCGKLTCTEFRDGGPDYHAMLCQVGKVSLRRGQWYRLAFWARGQEIKEGAVEVAISNTRSWENAGLAEAFRPRYQWERFEFLFRARSNLLAVASRLQFWFKTTGTLWLDDVELTEFAGGQQWTPTISGDGVKNWVPNSSFECGPANWGSFTWGLSGWAGNLYRLEEDIDHGEAKHGRHCLKITLGPQTHPVFWFDYYEPVRQPVRRVLAANQGWFQVRPGKTLTLSAFLRADGEKVPAQLAVIESPSQLRNKPVIVGTQWKRYEFTFRPGQPFLFIAVGLDLEASKRETASLWVDGVQLERGDQATEYQPRHEVESFLLTDLAGNVTTQAAKGIPLQVVAFNNSGVENSVRGQLAVKDFFDQEVLTRDLEFAVPARSASNKTELGACAGRKGFFRVHWRTGTAHQMLRCALIDPIDPAATDSPFGFNHAYPWDFLIRQARTAGIVWWRDWSAKWNTVEPQKGRFDFSVADEQINRVLGLNSQVEVLLPFSAASWSSTARPEEIRRAAPQEGYLRSRLPMAFAPKNIKDFSTYAAEVVRHYRQGRPGGITHYQILNEPLYTDYALPQKYGYTLADYLRLLETSYRAMKAVDPKCSIVGGISAHLRSHWTSDFITQGGLRFVDVFDLHLYDSDRPVESYEEPFRSLEALMRVHGGPKPVWITEWGCYADDDPPCYPHTVGDDTMNRCRWPSERAATEHIVKFTAVSFAYGVRKIFFHAGTCGTINGPDAGGVLFEYGGTPRKMYPGVAVLTRLLGVPHECVRIVNRAKVRAYVFRTNNRLMAVAWCLEGQKKPLKLSSEVTAYDIMGNKIPRNEMSLSESPIYLNGPSLEAITRSLMDFDDQNR